MKLNQTVKIIGLLVGVMASVWAQAIEVTTDYRYYFADPKSAKDVDNAILVSSPVSPDNPYHRIVGSFAPSVTVPVLTLGYNPRSKRCYVSEVKIKLYGIITMPKLVPSEKYPEKILTAFAIKQQDTQRHEERHRDIWVTGLNRLENKIKAMTRQNSVENCAALKHTINRFFDESLAVIRRENAAFDCFEYGNRLDQENCGKFAGLGAKVTTPITFSSATSAKDNATNVSSFSKKPDDTACAGKLIEPFKGKFYCITGDYLE